MLFTKLQNSGFEYKITRTEPSNKYGKSRKLTIRNITDKKVLFSIQTRTGVSAPDPVSKTFYGLDDRYYHVKLRGWRKGERDIIGQVTPSGAILGNNRTIIGNISFYPIYTEGISKAPPTSVPDTPPIIIPTLKPVVKTVPVPVVSAIPAVISTPIPPTITKEEMSWIKIIQNLLTKMKMWIIKILNR